MHGSGRRRPHRGAGGGGRPAEQAAPRALRAERARPSQLSPPAPLAPPRAEGVAAARLRELRARAGRMWVSRPLARALVCAHAGPPAMQPADAPRAQPAHATSARERLSAPRVTARASATSRRCSGGAAFFAPALVGEVTS